MARPKQADRIDIRHEAIMAAIGLMQEMPARDITLRRIADHIGCRPPALYHYFANREALLEDVCREGFNQLAALKQKARSNAADNPVEQLRQGGLTFVRFASRSPELYRLMFAAEPTAVAMAETSASMQGLQNVVRACQSCGYFAGQSPEDVAMAFWSSVHGAIMLTFQQDDKTSKQAIATAGNRVVATMMHLAEGSVPSSKP